MSETNSSTGAGKDVEEGILVDESPSLDVIVVRSSSEDEDEEANVGPRKPSPSQSHNCTDSAPSTAAVSSDSDRVPSELRPREATVATRTSAAEEESTLDAGLSLGLQGIRNDPEFADTSNSPWAESSPLCADESSAVDATPPFSYNFDAESPFSYNIDAAMGNYATSTWAESSALFSDDPSTRNIMAESCAVLSSTGLSSGQQNNEGQFKSPFPYSVDTAVGARANSSFAQSSPLFADDWTTRNITSESPLARPPGLEEIVHEDAAPLPPGGIIESITDSEMKVRKARGVVEETPSSDDGPPAPAAVEKEFGGSSATRKIRGEFPEQIQDSDGPDPFTASAAFGDDDIAEKMRGQTAGKALKNYGLNSMPQEIGHIPHFPPTQHVSERNTKPRFNIRAMPGTQINRSSLGASNPDVAGWSINIDVSTRSPSSNLAPILRRDESLPRIPVAFLVEDRDIGEVLIATPVKPARPLWRKKRVVCFFVLVIMCVSAIVAAVTSYFAGKQEALVVALPTSSPTTSDMPTNSAPSASPTACALKITKNAEELKIPVDHPVDTQVAVDGRNAVVVTRERNTENIHIIFYVLENNGWEKRNHFNQYGGLGEYYFTVDLSGTVVFVGFPNADVYTENDDHGIVSVYRQDSLGEWVNIDYLYRSDEDIEDARLFGSSVDIDGDLACVVADGVLYSGSTPVYIFQKDESDFWLQLRRFDLPHSSKAEKCFINGNAIAIQIDGNRIDIYKYDHDIESYKEIQEPFRSDDEISLISFGQDGLVYSTRSRSGACYVTGIFVYRRQEMNGTYTLQQQLDSASARHDECDSVGFDTVISHDSDVLVVKGANASDFFILDNNGNWELSLTLDKSFREYHISGRNLLTTLFNNVTEEDEVYYLSIEDCALTPTQMPSSSTAPSSSTLPTFVPTHAPTKSAAPSLVPPSINPSSSISPTATKAPSSSPSVSIIPTETCYWLDISIVFDGWPTETSWDVQQINAAGDNAVLNEFEGNEVQHFMSHEESICLEEGQYQFTIYDSYGDGLLDPGHYNLTSYGELIYRGTEFKYNETSTFSLPLTPVPSTTPSISYEPSPLPSSSVRPSSSTNPTTSTVPTTEPSSSAQPSSCSLARVDVPGATFDYGHAYSVNFTTGTAQQLFGQSIFKIGSFVGFEGNVAIFDNGDSTNCQPHALSRSGTVTYIQDNCEEDHPTLISVVEDPICFYSLTVTGLCCPSEWSSL